MRLNRRMHNKSFTADGEATIVGGRNVGDEYFGASHDLLFVDLDVLAIGAVVRDVTTDFERYWTSNMSQPAERVLGKRTALRPSEAENAAESMFLDAVARSTFVSDLLNGQLVFEWAKTQLVSDPPEKISGRAPDESLIGSRLRTLLGEPKSELLLVSPYFVPAYTVNALFLPLARKGVQIEVLTNSLEATDVAAVHSGYAKWRKQLLRAGVRLHEIRRRIDQAARRSRSRGWSGSGSSGASLHAKTFAVDGARVFIGSFNFDPRSARLNTEMGFLIDSPALAQQTAAAFSEQIPAQAYEVRLGDTGRLQWIERADGETRLHDREPGVRPLTRFGVWVLSKLPIDWLL